MAKVIAVAGKGGVGKTTLCSLLVNHLCESGRGPVLAVDADANSNLNEVLGVQAGTALAEIREELERSGSSSEIPAGIDKRLYTGMKLNAALAEDDDFDLLVMGRSQGKGCYCFVNRLLEIQLNKLQHSYPYIVVDNEAGMEHINRGILPKVDALIIVSDCSRRGIQAASKISRLADKMELEAKVKGLIVNQVPEGKLSSGTAEEIQKQGLNLMGIVPQNEMVYQYDCAGKPLVRLPAESPVKQALADIAENLK